MTLAHNCNSRAQKFSIASFSQVIRYDTEPQPTASGVNPNGVEDINIDEEWYWLGALSTVGGAEIVAN